MQWIEVVLHLSPDKGDGSTELAVALTIVTVAITSLVTIGARRRARRERMRHESR
jgi:hypothetical protein